MTSWLPLLSTFSLLVAGECALVVLIDILAGHKQHMPIMNAVWIITALYAGPLGLWAYYHWGRRSTHRAMMEAKDRGEKTSPTKPHWQIVSTAALHCGSGCTLGDILAESLLLIFPFTLFGHAIFAAWVLDFIFALLLGLAFQYFTIKPMKNLSAVEGLKAAIKADVLSLTAWQVGMYGWMALVVFGVFHHEIEKTSPVFWFLMQLAMLAGFFISYPINAWLLGRGIKEPM